MKRILARVTVSLVVLGGGIGADALARAQPEGDPPQAPKAAGQPPQLPRDERDAVPRTSPPPQPVPAGPAAPPTVPAREPAPFDLGAELRTDPEGRLVVGTVPAGSPAALIGLMPGDQVLMVDGRPIRQRVELEAYLGQTRDRFVPLAIVRDGAEITLQYAPPEPNVVAVREVVTARPALGVTFVQGPRLRVLDVIPNSAADRIGLRRADVIISLNGERFPSTDHFLTAVAAADFNLDHEIVFVREGQRHVGTFQFDPWDAVYPDTHTITALRPAFDHEDVIADVTDVTVHAHGCHGHPHHYHPHYFGSVYAGPYFYAPYPGPIYYGPAFYWGYGVPYYAPWWPYYSAAYAGSYVGWQWW